MSTTQRRSLCRTKTTKNLSGAWRKSHVTIDSVRIPAVAFACTLWASSGAFAQIKPTKEQILFYTSDWKGDRFPDGRPKIAWVSGRK